MSTPNWWGDWRPNLPAHSGDLQATDLIECTSIVGGVPVNTVITGQQIIDASGGGGGGASWGSITGTLSSQTDLQTALNGKEPTITAGTTAQYYRGDKTFQTLNKSAVGLGNVDNTSDANKPISTATQTALNAKQDTLVSGTNIKTINSTSLLGSGNIDVASSPYVLLGNQIGTQVTGTIANIISASQVIAANKLLDGNVLQIRSKIFKSVSSSTTNIRMYINTSNSLTGATLIASAANMTALQIQSFWRDFPLISGNLYCYSPATLISSDITNGAYTLVPFNPSNTYYIIFALQNGAISEITNFINVNVSKYAV